jgi:predicted phage terminase large subunit-like protein
MSNFTQKNIENVVVGDKIVGFTFSNRRTRWQETTVTAVHSHAALVKKYTLASGGTVTCTPDHKWWTGRFGVGVDKEKDLHKKYSQLGFKKNEIKGLVKVFVEPEEIPEAPEIIRAAGYIGGIFDGEGGYNGGAIHFHQNEEIHDQICRRIRYCLRVLGFDWGETHAPARPGIVDFFIRGGKEEKLRFLRWCDPAKNEKFKWDILHTTRQGNYRGRDNLVEIGEEFEAVVYNLTTDTGNYVANGYASKNSQYLLNPLADSNQGFLKEWLKYWQADNLAGLVTYILCDPAGAKKKSRKHDPDYTVFFVMGLGKDGNWYVINMLRDRLSLTERADRLFEWHRKYHPIFVGYEKYGKDSDIEHYSDRMQRENYRFPITELGGNIAKVDRIRGLVPLFENGRIYLPEELHYQNYEGITRDLTHDFIYEEYLTFPVASHDDMIDCLARITDPAVPKWYGRANNTTDFTPNRGHLAPVVKGFTPRRRVSA